MYEDDVRYLLSALIQMLPTVFSIVLIAIFSVSRNIKLIGFKRYSLSLLLISIMTMGSLLYNIVTLLRLNYLINTNSIQINNSILFSFITIGGIFLFFGFVLGTITEIESSTK